MLIDRGTYLERIPDQRPTAAAGYSTRARVSVDTEAQTFGALLTAAVVGPISADDTWSAFDLDTRTLARMSPTRLLELLADLSPEVSRELWNFLRMCNPGFTATAMRPSGKMAGTAAHQAALDSFLMTLKTRYGSLDVIIGRLFTGAFLRGALMAELVLSNDARTPLDIATPDPATARWRQRADPELGTVYDLGQWQGGQFVLLADRDTIRYLPVDPFPGHPEGRAIAGPALFTAVFLLAMLHDIRRVVQQQGYPRIDVVINLEKVIASYRQSGRPQTPEGLVSWVQAAVRDVEAAYAGLQPDDAYIHTDDIEVNRPVGTVDSSSLGAVSGIIEALERMLVRALKSMPLLLATNQTGTETQSNREWEVYAAGIKAIQHLCEGLLEHLFTLALRAQGIPAVVQWRFAELRAAELLRDAQSEQLQLANTVTKYTQGYISQDEASQMAVGHAPDVDTPRSSAGAGAPAAIGVGDQGNAQ